MQEVGLVLARVRASQQAHQALFPRQATEMAGGDVVRAAAHGVVQKGAELDLRVAEYVRIGRAAAAVLLQEVGEDAVPVAPGEVHAVIGDADLVADLPHVVVIGGGGADAVLVLLLPVLHEHAHDLVALFLQQQRGDGGVHAAGHADHHALSHCLPPQSRGR